MVDNETTRTIWNVLLAKGEDGKTLMGLLEATCNGMYRKHSIGSLYYRAFPEVSSLVYQVITVFCKLDILSRFDEERGGGIKNFPGYLANQCRATVLHLLQDERRKESVSADDVITPELEEMQAARVAKGLQPHRYIPATRTGVSVVEGEKEVREYGTRETDWCGRCDWSASQATTYMEHTTVFMDKMAEGMGPHALDFFSALSIGLTMAEAAKEAGITYRQGAKLAGIARQRLQAA